MHETEHWTLENSAHFAQLDFDVEQKANNLRWIQYATPAEKMEITTGAASSQRRSDNVIGDLHRAELPL